MTSRFFRGRRRSRGGRFAGGLAGFAAGAGLMYFLDPRRGPGRRSQLSQRVQRVVRDVEQTVQAGARDLEHRALGLAHEARARVRQEDAPDDVVVERVRSKLGRITSHPSAIRVAARGGRVELSGPVLASEHARVVRSVRLVRGVHRVDDRLEPHETGEGVPGLRDGGRAPPGPALGGTLTPANKLLFGAVGALLLARALFGRGLLRLPAAIAGMAFLRRFLGESGPAAREARRLARAASEIASRERERREDREGHRGAWHGEAEVMEVKSPAELEAEERRDRGDGRSAIGPEEAAAARREVLAAPGQERVAPASDRGLREGGPRVSMPPDVGDESAEGSEGGARAEGSAAPEPEEGAPRREPS